MDGEQSEAGLQGGGGEEERIRDYVHNHSDANERCARVHGMQAIALKPRGEEPLLLLLPARSRYPNAAPLGSAVPALQGGFTC